MTEQQASKQESFRDRLATADKSGKRIWVYPAKPKGPFYRARSMVAALLLIFLFAAPFIKIDGQPLLLFNILQRRFIIFGVHFWPQDFHLFVLAAITLGVFVILFTAVFGRLFCGWVCPQTIFMEMVFRRIEYWIEGGPAKQRRLDKQPWNEVKLFKKGLKHLIFFGISFLIGNIFLAYIIGADALLKIISDPPSQHLGGLTAMIIFSLVFYGVFAWFREQVCTMVCPYGRLQSVLVDKNSIMVMYDYKRGEPRAPMTRGAERSDAGDCVECNACVAVCPTGIDIRNGTQLECVNCTACIDACNRTMRRVGLPEGLIRYSSGNAIATGTHRWLTGRVAGYSAALIVLLSILGTLLLTRSPIDTIILRAQGAMAQQLDNGDVRNLYSVKFVNKTMENMSVSLRLKAPQGGHLTLVSGEQVPVAADSLAESAFFVDLPGKMLYGPSTMVAVEVVADGKPIDEIKTTFIKPAKGSNR